MSSERGGTDHRSRGKNHQNSRKHRPTDEELCLERIPEETPDCLDPSINDGSDKWFQYQDELLFSPDQLPDIARRLETISDTEFERVHSVEATINAWRTVEFIDAVEQRWQEITNSHSFFVPLPTPDIEQQKDQQRAHISIEYPVDGSAITTVREWKRRHIMAKVREFDYWVYHYEVIQPSIEQVSKESV
jgi:hypothetical protein